MTCKLLGFAELDFETPKGDKIKGLNVFVAHKDSRITGMSCRKMFIGEKDLEVINIDLAVFVDKNIEIDLGFNNKIQAITAGVSTPTK